MQMGRAVGELDAVAGAQERRIGLHEGRRHEPLADQRLRAVDVGDDALEQVGALHEAFFDVAPLFGGHGQRNEIELPGPLRLARLGEDVVGDAVFVVLAARAFHALGHRTGCERAQCPHERLPMAADLPRPGDHFVEWRGRGVRIGRCGTIET